MLRSADSPTITAAGLVPATKSLKVLAAAAAECRICPWSRRCTQAAFGEGPKDAQIVFVGEQPGDQEDLQGHPFVGPAGRMFADVLDEVGIDRKVTYVTNAVKHFRFTPRGKRRMHQTPNARDVAACRPWMIAELELIKPPILVALAASAAKSLLGPQVRITKQRGQPTSSEWAPWTVMTYHPSAILRAPDEQLRSELRAEFTHDLKLLARQLQKIEAVRRLGRTKRTASRRCSGRCESRIPPSATIEPGRQ